MGLGNIILNRIWKHSCGYPKSWFCVVLYTPLILVLLSLLVLVNSYLNSSIATECFFGIILLKLLLTPMKYFFTPDEKECELRTVKHQVSELTDKLEQKALLCDQLQTTISELEKEETDRAQSIETLAVSEQAKKVSGDSRQALEQKQAALGDTLQAALDDTQKAALDDPQQALEQKQAALDDAQQALEQKQAALDDAQQALEQKQTALDDTQQALEQAQLALEESKLTIEEMQSALRDMTQSFTQMQESLEMTQGELDETSK